MKPEKLELWYPVKPFILNQGFGVCGSPELCSLYKSLGLDAHNGQDMGTLHGQTVRSAHDGVVTFAGEDGAGGLVVVIRTIKTHEYNGQQVYFKTVYAHLKKGSIIIVPGQSVKTGQIIAQADNTGASTGDHLHFALKPQIQGEADWVWENLEQNNGYRGAIDPNSYWTKYYAEDKEKVLVILAAIKEIWTKILKMI